MIPLWTSSCTKHSSPGVRIVAVLPFENLTGDPGLDWVREAGQAMLEDELAGSARVVARPAATLADARFEGVPQVLHTYYTREHGEIRLHFSVEDRGTQRMEPVSLASGPLVASVSALAHTWDPHARAFSTSNAQAVEEWARGDSEKALELDPDFGAAWLSRINSLGKSGNTDEALHMADEALARKTLHSDWSRAEIRVLAATIRKDFPARAAALTDQAALAPSDSLSLLAAAEAQTQVRNFSAAAALYRKSLATPLPDQHFLNSLGYAEGFAGNLDAARKALEDYGKLGGTETNAHDSMGEVYFLNGKFHEAESEFLKAYALDPKFLGGAPALKAAYAHWLGGDLPGADAMVRKFTATLVSSAPATAVWQQASWLYATGRQDQAMAMLAKAPLDDRIRRQLASWRNSDRLPTDLNTLKNRYDSTPPAQDGFTRVLYASALLGAGKEAEARSLLERWPLPETGRNPEFDSIMFRKYLELRTKLKMGIGN